MQWFGNLKTRTKLIGGFGLVCALMAVVGLFAVRELSTVNGSTVVIAGKWLPAVRAASAINTDIGVHRLKLLRIAMTDNKAEHAQMQRETAEVETRLAANRKLYESFIDTPKERAIYDELVKLSDENIVKYNEVLALIRDSKSQQALELMKGDSKLALEALMAKINELVALNNEGAQAATLTAGTAYAQARTWLVGLIAAGIGVALLLAFVIAGVISRPLSKAVEVLQAVADGDFTRTLDVTTRDEVGQLASALNQAVGGIRSALTDVRSSADAVASASMQLSAGSEEISSGAQEQASSLEETASSLEEIAATIKQSADNAQQANQLANGAREVAEKGGRVVSEAVQAMNEINQSSKQIADIINTIDEIAFQTNLLALNAAVEAARAGEQGRGFAVVAAEVRNLAKRSATSAKEIKVLIQDSVRKVENGTSLVNQSGQTLHDIVTAVKRVTDIVGEIAAATREQATGIDQVNRAVTQMDAVTQSNAGQTEELAGTAEALSAQAEELQTLVAKFRLETDGARHVSHEAAARVAHTTHSAHRGRPSARPLSAANGKSKKPARNTFGTSNTAPQREVLAGRFSSLDDEAADGAIFEEL